MLEIFVRPGWKYVINIIIGAPIFIQNCCKVSLTFNFDHCRVNMGARGLWKQNGMKKKQVTIFAHFITLFSRA